MEATYRPSRSHAGRLVAAWDEDEATMAIDAARLLVESGLKVSDVKHVVLLGGAGKGWGRTVQLALGLTSVAAEEVDAAEFARRQTIQDQGTLAIESHATRPRTGPTVPEAFAKATWQGRAGSKVQERPPTPISDDQADRIAKWETVGPNLVPMGAYIPRATWDTQLEARYRLLASQCTKCHDAQHPPVTVCAACGGPTKTEPLPRRAEVYSYTVISAGGAPSEFEALQEIDGSYGVVVADFPGGARVPGIVTDTPLDSLAIGLPVEAVLRRLYGQDGAWRYGMKFRTAP